MSFKTTILCYAIIIGFLATGIKSASKIDYYTLHQDLFGTGNTFYKSDVRPVNFDSEVMQVQLDFSLVSIMDLQEKEQTLVSFGYIYLTWDDDFLSWNETQYNNLISMIVPQKKVWRPDIVVGNSVERRTQIGFDELPIRLNSQGYIEWQPSILFKTSCDINIQYYPFDTQVCIIKLETMVSTIFELNLITYDSEILLDEYSPNGQWELINSLLEKNDESTKSGIHVTLTLRRRRTFYVLNVILPIMILSLMGSLTFALPSDSGEKMSLAITVLLAYVVFLTIISDSMPQTSLQISLLGVYVTILVALSALSVLISIPILRLHHKENINPLPASAVWFVHRIGKCCRTVPKSLNKIEATRSNTPSIQNFMDDDINLVTWKDVSKSVDCVFCWLFLSIAIVSTIIFMVVMLSI